MNFKLACSQARLPRLAADSVQRSFLQVGDSSFNAGR